METLGIAWSERCGFICRSCRQDAKHNEVLRISFCPVHGLASALDQIPMRPEARVRGYTHAPVTVGRPASLAAPAY